MVHRSGLTVLNAYRRLQFNL